MFHWKIHTICIWKTIFYYPLTNLIIMLKALDTCISFYILCTFSPNASCFIENDLRSNVAIQHIFISYFRHTQPFSFLEKSTGPIMTFVVRPLCKQSLVWLIKQLKTSFKENALTSWLIITIRYEKVYK